MAENKQLKTSFTGLALKSFRRGDGGIVASFSANLTAKVIDSMGWRALGDHEKSVSLEGKLLASRIILGASETLSQWESHIDAQEVSAFQGIRRELEGKKGKGFRHELHFDVKSGDRTGCKALEEYMLSIPGGKGSMIVFHAPEKPKQGTLDVSPNDEQKQAVLPEND